MCGSISDVVGNRRTYLVGCLLQCASTLACGLAKTGTQIIVFRAFSGIAASFSLPSAVSLINEVFPRGQSRNIAFAAMGGAQSIGFAIGLVLGGVITGTIGWNWGFYVAAISNFVMLGISTWQLPKNVQESHGSWLQRLAADIDWVGVILASAGLAMLSYIIAYVVPCRGSVPSLVLQENTKLTLKIRVMTGSPAAMKLPHNITLLVLSFALMLSFILWVGRQERLNRPALIPNSLWRHKAFSSICINVFCIWAAFNIFEQYQNFFFQEIQHISPLGAALRFLPAPISGALTSIVVGLIVHRVRADWIVIMTTIPCAIASVLMAVAKPRWSYWACAFIASFLNPIGADGIFTVSNLLITSMFPPKTQGVAGGVFNMVSQTGKSVGMALTALVANQVTANSRTAERPRLVGYRAAFWFTVGLASTSLCVSVWGLRKIGKVGRKLD